MERTTILTVLSLFLILRTSEAGWYYNEGEAAKVGIIVGTLVASLFVVVLFLLFIYCCLWKRRDNFNGGNDNFKPQRLPDLAPRPFLPDPMNVAHHDFYDMRKPPITQFVGGQDSPVQLREVVKSPVTLAGSVQTSKVSKKPKKEKRDASAQTRPQHCKNVQTSDSLKNVPVTIAKPTAEVLKVVESHRHHKTSHKQHSSKA